MKKYWIFFGFILVSLLFCFIRFYRFEDLMTFSSDQSLFLRDIWQMVETRKITLLGPMVISKIVDGRGFFTGPFFYYLLTPLAIFTNWDIVLMTKIFMSVWYFAGVALFFWIGKSKGYFAGLSTFLVYSVIPFFIDHNRFLWNPSPLPLLSVLLFWLLQKNFQKNRNINWFLIGLITGLGINLHYSAVLWLFVILVFWLYGLVKNKWKVLPILLVIFGVIVGEAPFLLFELRHDFYNLRTIFFILINANESDNIRRALYPYQVVLPLFAPIFWGWGSFIAWIQKRNVFFALAITLIATSFFFLKIDWEKSEGIGMAENWNINKQKLVAEKICKDARGTDFEIAETFSGDTRAADIRWFTERLGCKVMAVDEYPKADILYLVAPSTRLPEDEFVWEVQSIKPFQIEWKEGIGDDLFLYKLARQKMVQ